MKKVKPDPFLTGLLDKTQQRLREGDRTAEILAVAIRILTIIGFDLGDEVSLTLRDMHPDPKKKRLERSADKMVVLEAIFDTNPEVEIVFKDMLWEGVICRCPANEEIYVPSSLSLLTLLMKATDTAPLSEVRVSFADDEPLH